MALTWFTRRRAPAATIKLGENFVIKLLHGCPIVAAMNTIVNPRTRLVLVGDGPLAAALRSRLPEAVFCGMRTSVDLAAHYASADIFLFPSLTETFGNVTLEAMASGLAVVAFDYAAAHCVIGQQPAGCRRSQGNPSAVSLQSVPA